MNRILVVTALLATSFACGRPGPEREEPRVEAASAQQAGPGVVTRTTQGGHYTVEVRFDPPEPPMGDLFSVIATVRDRDGEPLEFGEVALDALMPHHGHGMETDPIDDPGVCEGDVCRHPGGVYRTEGFKFHMPGAWTVTVKVQGHRGPDDTTFVVDQR